MIPTRHELLSRFKNPVFMQHPHFSEGISTFSCLAGWNPRPIIFLPKIRLEIVSVDYIERPANAPQIEKPPLLRFQQDCYRFWFQVDGHGILQNTSRNIYGAARPGLIGIMERSQRYTYLHQKGSLECFQVLFSLQPSPDSKCYWNSAIEGKTVLEDTERLHLENLVFGFFLSLDGNENSLNIGPTARLIGIMEVLFDKGLLVIEESQFPRDKAKALVAKARAFMDLHYSRIRHQNEIEKECGVDINYLNILFKKETRETLYDYLMNVRMEHAKHLLESSKEAVTDIAGMVGYPNSNSFSRAFKRHAKRSPLDFRRSSQ